MPLTYNRRIESVDPAFNKNTIRNAGITGLSIVALHAIFVFLLPSITLGSFFKRVWGIDAIRYFPVWSIIFSYLIAVLVCIPAVNSGAGRTAAALLERFNRIVPHKGRRWIVPLIVLISIGIFRAFRAKYALLGDGLTRVFNLENGDFIPDECGSIYILHYFYRLVHLLFNVDAYSALQLFTYSAGAVFLFLVIRIAGEEGSDRFEKISIICFYILFGTIQHFCGYIEDYAPPVMLWVLYFYASILSLKGKIAWWVPGVALLVAIGAHLIGLVLVPSFVYIVFERRLKYLRFFRNYGTWVVGVAVISTVIFITMHGYIFSSFYPIKADGSGKMTMFSLIRMREFINGQSLACGIGLFLAPLCLAIAVIKKVPLTPVLYFLLIGSFFSFVFIFAFDENFGSGDWDVYSFPSLAINLLAILLFFHLFSCQSHDALRRYAMPVLLSFMALHTLPWVLVNATDLSIKRIERVMLADPGSSYLTNPAAMHLGVVFQNAGLKREALDMQERAFTDNKNDPRNWNNYIAALDKNNEPEKAMRMNVELIKRFPLYYTPILNLGIMAKRNNNDSLVFFALATLYNSYCLDSAAILEQVTREELSQRFSEYIHCLVQMKAFPAADRACSRLRAICSNEDYSVWLSAFVKLQEGNARECITLCDPLTRKNPAIRFDMPYTLMAQAYEEENDLRSAGKILNEGLERAKLPESRNLLFQELQKLGKAN